MDCLTFRRRLLEDPRDRADELRAHERQCPSCAREAAKVRAMEDQLHALLNTPVPSGLEDRVRLAVSFQGKRRSRAPLWSAMAAGVAALALGLVLWLSPGDDLSPLEQAVAVNVLHHIEEDAHLMRVPGPAAPARVRQEFGRFHLAVADLSALGRVNVAKECMMRKKNGVHLVIVGERGPVTVFFMPDEMLKRPFDVSSARYAGRIVPTNWGSVAVLGMHGEPVAPVALRMAAAVSRQAPQTVQQIYPAPKRFVSL